MTRSGAGASGAKTRHAGPVDRMRHTHAVAAVLLHPLTLALAATALAHLTALGTWFAQDDVSFIARARGIEPTPWSLARPLSEALAWRVLVALFGTHPLPMHAVSLALHLACTTLVYAIGARLTGRAWPAGAAAALFGVSGIAFTPLHWMSGLSELMATAFALAALLLVLDARAAGREGGARRAWLAAGATLGALLSKETTILLPLALLAADRRTGGPGGGRRVLLPATLVAVLYAAAFLLLRGVSPHLGGPAYAASAAPAHLFRNAATYLKWIASPGVPVRDVVAAVDPTAAGFGVVVTLILVLLLALQRRDERHPVEVGVVWFAAFLAPVLPLTAHTYLYYLYLPWAGLCWAIAAAAARVTLRSAVWRWAAVALVLAFAGLETYGVRAREAAMVGTLPLDKTMRESLMLRNVVTDLRRANVTAGDSLAFVNPAPRLLRMGLARLEDADPSEVASYVPLEAAMRGGEAIRVFFPGAAYLGFATGLPDGWERARAFLYQDEGTLRGLGRGAPALTELGLFALRLEDWKMAEGFFARGMALGDTLPDAAYGMIASAYFQGHRHEAMRRGAAFLGRWPDDPRAAELALRLQQEAELAAAGSAPAPSLPASSGGRTP